MIEAGITFLPTLDLAATRTFYENLLSLRIVVDQGACLIFELCPGSYLGFCARSEPLVDPGKVVITWVTDEVDVVHRQWSAAGVPTDPSPQDNPNFGIYHFYAEDPNGYRLEVQRFHDSTWSQAKR